MELKFQTGKHTLQEISMVDPTTGRCFAVIKGWNPSMGLDKMCCATKTTAVGELAQYLFAGAPFEPDYFQLYKDESDAPLESSYYQLMKQLGYALSNSEYDKHFFVPHTLVLQPMNCQQIQVNLK